ncbi:hypothetical protein [uncultured Acetatifactor sp.]|uniref:hypothetical protein n=1 Tax=uncultured Acetatifactor sp. TaxID=1671927 RepID=UPI0026339AEC|nr:hypothetical protein [uncultured Acetatifactor sp.]
MEKERKKLERQYDYGTIILKAENDISKENILNSSQVHSLNTWDGMIEDQNAFWSIQTKDALQELIPYGRMRFWELAERPDHDNHNIKTCYDNIYKLAKEKAATITQDFDMAAIYQEQVKKETYIEIPREVKRGLFRKETIYEKQKEVKTSYKTIREKFNGWNLAHFEKQYIWNAGTYGYITYTNWDYCLGDDGELYHITTSYTKYNETSSGPTDYTCSVRKVIPYDNKLLKNQNHHLFIAVSHGLICAMDEMPLNFSNEYRLNNGQAQYKFNFPILPVGSNAQNTSFVLGDEGIIARLNNLK